MWSLAIALYRVLFILAQVWLKSTLGERLLLKLLIVYGLLSIPTGAFYNYIDDKGSMTKACFHYSAADMIIIKSYQGPML
jgi:hypothetical protein